MAFRFNFSNEGDDDRTSEDSEPVSKKLKAQSVAEFKEITVEDCKTVYPCDLETHTYNLSDKITVYCYDAGAVEEILKKDKNESSIVVKATRCHSDLVPNVYEGGLTIWECGLDLATHIAKNEDFTNKTVLELGCGAGIPGICAVKLGANEVHFQDYNIEVLEEYTIPNVTQLNLDDCKCTCRYLSGDWSEFCKEIPNITKYDVILTAETIYNPDNYQKLHDVFFKCLKRDGVIYIAAKSNYFGVGGGTRLFEEFVEKNGNFKSRNCEIINAGIPREIIQLTWKR